MSGEPFDRGCQICGHRFACRWTPLTPDSTTAFSSPVCCPTCIEIGDSYRANGKKTTAPPKARVRSRGWSPMRLLGWFR